jgi:hypothetical protein
MLEEKAKLARFPITPDNKYTARNLQCPISYSI